MTVDRRIWTNARLATLDHRLSGLGPIESGAIASEGGRITYVGSAADLPAGLTSNAEQIDCEGRWITPGFVDCHTHLVYAGNRAKEFELRLNGASYEEIAQNGGGIVSSVNQVRAASELDLVKESLPRLDALLAEGVTTIEVKSGYGLTIEDEAKILRAARQLSRRRAITVRTSYLGAHTAPSIYKGRNRQFIEDVVLPGLRSAYEQGLVDAVDGFCEGIAFSPDEIRLVFAEAERLGLPVKLHADQLSNLQGAALAAEFGALSADHLEYTDEAGVIAMANHGTIAVLLPGAFYFLRETRRPPVELFRQHGVAMALATDSNPGTSPLTSLLLTMNMGATLFGLTIEECLAGVTREAAKALGMQNQIGSLEVGKRADFAIWNIEAPSELVYRIGFNPLHRRVWNGEMTRMTGGERS